MQTPHPWRELRRLKRLVLHWQELRPGMWGATDGERVWLDPRQLQVERRCTLAHELEHIRRGHRGCQGPRSEASVRHAAAVYLAPDPDAVADALVWAQGDLGQAADSLWLDHPTMEARLDLANMCPGERAIIDARVSAEVAPP